eukprot:m.1996 g.1996  ORF g.1996 m.1996 type:complete len:56 (+) comp2145_c0_seq1:143-310(+)
MGIVNIYNCELSVPSTFEKSNVRTLFGLGEFVGASNTARVRITVSSAVGESKLVE